MSIFMVNFIQIGLNWCEVAVTSQWRNETMCYSKAKINGSISYFIFLKYKLEIIFHKKKRFLC